MVQNARITAFTVSELLREFKQEGRGVKLLPTQIRVKQLLQNFIKDTPLQYCDMKKPIFTDVHITKQGHLSTSRQVSKCQFKCYCINNNFRRKNFIIKTNKFKSQHQGIIYQVDCQKGKSNRSDYLSNHKETLEP